MLRAIAELFTADTEKRSPSGAPACDGATDIGRTRYEPPVTRFGSFRR